MERWTPEELRQQVKDSRIVMVDLRADWCVQCEPQERALERLLPEYEGEVAIASIDVGEHPRVASDYGISSLPAFLFFCSGNYHHSVTGFKRAPQLRHELTALISESG